MMDREDDGEDDLVNAKKKSEDEFVLSVGEEINRKKGEEGGERKDLSRCEKEVSV